MVRRFQDSSKVAASVVIASVVASVNAHAAAPVIAVFDIRDKSGRFQPPELEQLSTYLSAQLASTRAFRIIPRAQIKEALSGQKADSYKACYDESCQIEIGKELAAEKSVLTEIIAVGTQCAVTSTLYDLATSASELAATEKTKCNQDALVSALEKVAARLSGREPEPPVATAAPAADPTQRALTARSAPPADTGWSTGTIMVVGGWATFGLGYLGTVVGTMASEPFDGQTTASLIPLYGPVRVESINKENNFDSGGLPYVGMTVQALGLVTAVIGHLLPSGVVQSKSGATATYSVGVSPGGISVSGRF